MRKKYSHLENVVQTEYDWASNLMVKSLPDRAFKNPLTSNIIMSMQLILVKGFKTADSIRSYFRF